MAEWPQSIALSTLERTEALSSGSTSEDSAEIVVMEEAGQQDLADKEKVSSSGNSEDVKALLHAGDSHAILCGSCLESATVDKSRLVDFTLSMIYHPSSVFQRCALHAAMLTSANEVAQRSCILRKIPPHRPHS